MKLLQILSFLAVTALFAGCISTPSTAQFNGQTVGTFSIAAGCDDLGLDEDCGMSGGTREITLGGIELRIAGGDNGHTVFVMSRPKMIPDSSAVEAGAIGVKNYLEERGVHVVETKVMYSNNTLAGVHFRLDGDGYSLLKELSE